MRLYVVVEVVSRNTMKLTLLASVRIHLVVNVSRMVRYREPVKRQKMKEPKLVEVNGVEKWEV